MSNHLGESNRFRPRAPLISFQDRLHTSRLMYSHTLPSIGGINRRHYNDEAAAGYNYLCSKGFVVQASLDPNDPLLADAFRVIDRIGWTYTVLHVQPFNPRVVREFISNKNFDAEGSLIRGHVYHFEPSVINRLMMTPSVEDSFQWEVVVLNQAIVHLTRGQCFCWTGFSLAALVRPYQTLYRVCELNWLPGPATDSMIQDRLRLLYAVATRKRIDFGRLVYDQVIEMARRSDWCTDLIFPNLIYQLLMLQKEVPLLPGDEGLIGGGVRIYGTGGD
ncbi:hypothetical protein Bca101_022825 [Brassica carinata]